MKKTKQLIITCCLFIGAASLLFFNTIAKAGNKSSKKETKEITSDYVYNFSDGNETEIELPAMGTLSCIPCCVYAGTDKTAPCDGSVKLGTATTALCVGSCANGLCPTSYSWSPTANLSCTNCAQPTFTTPCGAPGYGSVIYTLTVTCSACGPYTDQVTVSWSGCGDCSSRIGHFNTGEEKENYDIKVFPNPSSGKVTLEFNGSFTDELLQVYDMNGSLVKEMKVQKKTMQVDMSNVAKGAYFIQVTKDNEGLLNKKILIQ